MNNPLEPLNNLQSAGKIVVNSDEWTLSNTGFAQAPDTATFVTNIAKWFTGGRSTGKFYAYSTNFGLTESVLAETLAKAGYTWTVGNNIKIDLPTLLTFDGIFLCGDLADNQVLIDYVKAGVTFIWVQEQVRVGLSQKPTVGILFLMPLVSNLWANITALVGIKPLIVPTPFLRESKRFILVMATPLLI